MGRASSGSWTPAAISRSARWEPGAYAARVLRSLALLSVVVVTTLACRTDDARPAVTGGSAAPTAVEPVSSSAAAEPGSGASLPATRGQCLAVRDRSAALLLAYYVKHPDETWDGLDRSDPGVTAGLPPDLTKDNFATFLATDAGRAWIGQARDRAVAAPAMAVAVERCVAAATGEHVACWLGATTFEAFQGCPNPG